MINDAINHMKVFRNLINGVEKNFLDENAAETDMDARPHYKTQENANALIQLCNEQYKKKKVLKGIFLFFKDIRGIYY